MAGIGARRRPLQANPSVASCEVPCIHSGLEASRSRTRSERQNSSPTFPCALPIPLPKLRSASHGGSGSRRFPSAPSPRNWVPTGRKWPRPFGKRGSVSRSRRTLPPGPGASWKSWTPTSSNATPSPASWAIATARTARCRTPDPTPAPSDSHPMKKPKSNLPASLNIQKAERSFLIPALTRSGSAG